MMGIVKRTTALGIVLAAGLLWSAPADAQGIVVGTGIPGVTTSTASYLALGGGMNYPGSYPPYGNGYGSPYSPYPYPYVYDSAGDYLRGAADVYRSYGNYAVNYAQSQILMEKARQDVLDTRRKIYDQWLYEKNNTPSLQDLRERDQRLELRRALNDPPLVEITDGRALNALLQNAIKASSLAGTTPNVPVSADVIKNINVAVDVGVGLGAVKGLRDGAPLDWPPVLQTGDYNTDRKELESLLREAVEDAARTGTVNINTLQKIQTDYTNLTRRLDDNIFTLTADQYLAGKRYLKQLDNSINALQRKGVEKYFNRLDKVRNVADLIREMTAEKGFAPAGLGDENSYVALHHALVAYMTQLQRVAPEK
jgi:hypothetical protein